MRKYSFSVDGFNFERINKAAARVAYNNGNKTLYFCLIWRCCNVCYYLFNIISFCSVG